MLRLKITREGGRYYWTITQHGQPVYGGTRSFGTEEEADADARVKWEELTGQRTGDVYTPGRPSPAHGQESGHSGHQTAVEQSPS